MKIRTGLEVTNHPKEQYIGHIKNAVQKAILYLLIAGMFLAAASHTVLAAEKNGLVKKNGHQYYYQNGSAVKNQIVSVGGKTLYFNASGHMVTGPRIIKKKHYYFRKNGDMLRGAFQKVKSGGKTKIRYYGEDGTCIYGLKKIGKNKYYFDPDNGAMAVSRFVEYKGKTYYFDSKGRMVRNTKKKIGSKKYTFRKTGEVTAKRYLVTCNWHYDNGRNTLGKYSTLAQAKKRVQKIGSETRGEWFIYDSIQRKVVWPNLTTTDQKVKKAVAWLKAVARDNRHGYTCEGENSSTNLRLYWGRWGAKGDYSCSTLAATAYELVGLGSMRQTSGKYNIRMTALGVTYIGYNSTSTARSALKTGHFKDVTAKLKKYGKGGLKAGDVLVGYGANHIGVYVGNGTIVEATMNEIGREYAGYPSVTPGDQTGGEIRFAPYDGRWGNAYRPC